MELILSVVPEPVVLSDIDFSIGSSWIPSNVVSQWVFSELLDEKVGLHSEEAKSLLVKSRIGRGFNERLLNCYMSRQSNLRLGLRDEYNKSYSHATDIVAHLLTSNQPTIMRNFGTTETLYVRLMKWLQQTYVSVNVFYKRVLRTLFMKTQQSKK